MRRALWLVGLLLLAAACTRESGISPGDGNSDPAGASRNPVMSMERLQELALELPDDFSDGLSTRSARKMIREVVPVTDFIDGSLLEPFAASVAASGTKAAATRAGGVAPANASPGSLSAEADVAATLGRIYVVNYEDDAGFAILSADRQLPSVLGYADSGNITDTMTNPGIKLFLERLPDGDFAIVGFADRSRSSGRSRSGRRRHRPRAGARSLRYDRGVPLSSQPIRMHDN